MFFLNLLCTVRSVALIEVFFRSLLTHDVSAALIHYKPTPTNLVAVTNVFIRIQATVLQPVWKRRWEADMTNITAISVDVITSPYS